MTSKWDTSGKLNFVDTPAGTFNSADLNDSLEQAVAPIGTIVGWNKSLSGTPDLPGAWVECNGQTLSDADSPMNGQAIPNLNASGGGTKRFLRGKTTSGSTAGADSTDFSHTHANIPASVTVLASGSTAHPKTSITFDTQLSATQSILPSYYEVVFIIRIK